MNARHGFVVAVAATVMSLLLYGIVAAQDLGTPPITLEDPAPEAYAQFSEVAVGDVNGDGLADIVVGATGSTVDSKPFAGQAFVFLAPDFTTVITLQDPVPKANAYFGTVAVGDVNGDGLADVVVGAGGSDEPTAPPIPGQAFVFLAPAFTSVITLQDPEPEPRALFGSGVAVEDVNGDGLADVVVGAEESNVGTGDFAGQAFVFLAPGFTNVITLENPLEPGANTFFGEAVGVGDVNGDGLADVVVGAGGSTVASKLFAGRAFVFLAPDLTTVTTLEDPEPETFAEFGAEVAVGDVNGDGLADLIVGADESDVDTTEDAGQAFIFLAPDFTTVMTLQDPEPEAGADFGSPAVGDVNGDGLADVVVGAWGSTVDSKPFAGQAFVFLAPDFTTVITLEDPEPEADTEFGDDVAVGDVNGDGRADVIMGNDESDVGSEPDAGQVFVFLAFSTEGIEDAVNGLSPDDFKSEGPGHQAAIASILGDIEQTIAEGNIDEATRKLHNLRRKVDGCGTEADRNDWITDCEAQLEVRALIDALTASLSLLD